MFFFFKILFFSFFLIQATVDSSPSLCTKVKRNKYISCVSRSLESFTCVGQNTRVEKIYLQSNNIKEINVKELLVCYPNLRYINGMNNQLTKITCDSRVKFVFSCQNSFVKIQLAYKTNINACKCGGNAQKKITPISVAKIPADADRIVTGG